MEPQDEQVVEQDDSEDLEVRLGMDIPDEAIEPDELIPDEDPEEATLPLRVQARAAGRGIVHEDFQDERWVGVPTQMRVKPKVLEAGGTKFLRITGSPGDTQAIPDRLAQQLHRSRSTVTFTSHYSSMPLLTESNMRQTYQADLRISPHCPNGCSVFELFQGAPGGEGGYGQQNGTGPAGRFTVLKGRLKYETRYRNETKVDVYDLGVAANVWNTVRAEIVWSHDARKGRMDIYVNGRLKHSIRGRDVCLGPASNRLPMVKFGLYGDQVAGTCDVNNIHLYPTGGYVPGTPPTQPPVTPAPEPERRTRAANCGGEAYTATDATVYAKDKGFAGGRKETMKTPMAGTEDVPLYQSWRYGKRFEYSAPFANGLYTLTLHFAEHLHTASGQRVFDVEVEGEPVLTRLDVFAKVGAKTAYVVEIPVTVSDQALTVGFEGLIGNAMVSAIKVEPR